MQVLLEKKQETLSQVSRILESNEKDVIMSCFKQNKFRKCLIGTYYSRNTLETKSGSIVEINYRLETIRQRASSGVKLAFYGVVLRRPDSNNFCEHDLFVDVENHAVGRVLDEDDNGYLSVEYPYQPSEKEELKIYNILNSVLAQSSI